MKSIDLLRNASSFAVIGVTPNQDKFGYRIYHRLKELNKHVYGITPLYETVDGDPMYPSLAAVDQPIDVVVFVINKKYASEYLKDMTELGILYAWMQPGTYDEGHLKAIEALGITPIPDCVLVQAEYL